MSMNISIACYIFSIGFGTIYLLVPMMGEDTILSAGTYVDGVSAITNATIPRTPEIAHTILCSLPYSTIICIVVSFLCAYFFSKAITTPIQDILDATNHMAVLDWQAVCNTGTNDEIGILANQSTISKPVNYYGSSERRKR